MVNKSVLIGLIIVLLQAASAEEANCEPSLENGALPHFISLGKSIDGRQSVLEDALERMSAEIEATEERCTQKVSKLERKLEELRNQQTIRMLEEVKATEERCTQKVSELEGKLEYLIDLQKNSSTPHKRPAELACEKTRNLLTAGVHNETRRYDIHFVNDYDRKLYYGGVLIEKRFVLAREFASYIQQYEILEFSFADEVVSKKIKKVYNPLDILYISLIELDSDVDYNYWLYPTCLYASELNPNSALMIEDKTMQIVEDSNCYDAHYKKLSPFQICVDNGCDFMDLVYLVEGKTTPELFGFVHCKLSGKYRPLLKVFAYLNFIESIVWPKNEN